MQSYSCQEKKDKHADFFSNNYVIIMALWNQNFICITSHKKGSVSNLKRKKQTSQNFVEALPFQLLNLPTPTW